MDGALNMDAIGKAQAAVCTSSKDLRTLGNLITSFDHNNRLIIPSITSLAELIGASRTSVGNLIKRAVDCDLFAKLNKHEYFLNPFIILPPKIYAAGRRTQELAQADWLKLIESGIVKSNIGMPN